MKREYERERNLPSFQLALVDLERLLAHMDQVIGGQGVDHRIDVRLPGKNFSFESVAEARESRELPARLKLFYVRAYREDRHIRLRRGLFSDPVEVSVTGESEAWCAGAVEVVYQFIKAHRVWYSWFRDWVLGAIVLLLTYVPLFFLTPLNNTFKEQPWFFGAWIVALLVFAVLYFGRAILLPAGVLVISARESVVRRYMPELTLIMAALALVLTIIGWFVKG